MSERRQGPGQEITAFVNRPYSRDEFNNFRYGEGWSKWLPPFEPISDTSLCIGIIGNSKLRPDQLMLSSRDWAVVKFTIPIISETLEFSLPGKSALILLEPNVCDREFVYKIVRVDLSGEPDRHDHLYVATVSDIANCGWIAYWVPLQLEGKFPHVRLVAERTIDLGVDPTIEDATRLSQILTKTS